MMLDTLKRVVVGRPIATADQEHQRLIKLIALAVFSSDAISSTAYATEEILFVTATKPSTLDLGLSVLVPIAVAVAILLAIVVTSYRQTIFAYPSGGGSYVVSRENLGERPSLVAGASLLVDYILTVAVSISAGVAAIVSIPQLEGLRDHRVELGVALIAIISLVNLRGVKESGRVFAIPTYVYIVVLTALVALGLSKSLFGWFGGIEPIEFDPELARNVQVTGGTLGLFLILKGFSSGAVALTGVEAISNGVPAFRRPESKNAAATLVWMAVILGTLFFGVSVLAHHLKPFPSHEVTVFAQLGSAVFGDGLVFWILQLATGRHSHSRGEHRLRRLSASVIDHRPRRLSPPPARQPRRPAGLLERRPRARGRGSRVDHRLRRCHHRIDPAVCRRRVLVVHPLASRHGAPSPQTAGARVATRCRDQRCRSDRNCRRAPDRGRDEVHERCVGSYRGHTADRVAVQGDQPALPRCWRSTADHTQLPASTHESHSGRARGRDSPRGARRCSRTPSPSRRTICSP